MFIADIPCKDTHRELCYSWKEFCWTEPYTDFLKNTCPVTCERCWHQIVFILSNKCVMGLITIIMNRECQQFYQYQQNQYNHFKFQTIEQKRERERDGVVNPCSGLEQAQKHGGLYRLMAPRCSYMAYIHLCIRFNFQRSSKDIKTHSFINIVSIEG